jgi:hypothetical protein
MPIGDRFRRPRRRRIVRWGEMFTSDELADGEVELEEPPPGPEPPEDEQAEPWGLGDDVPEGKHRRYGRRLQDYREFLRQWREDHPVEPEGEEEEAGA